MTRRRITPRVAAAMAVPLLLVASSDPARGGDTRPGVPPARPEAERAKRPPNVVVILADDLGWRDTSVGGGSFYETPNLERLARRGRRFTRFYAASPLGSPSRAALLTGVDPARLHFTASQGHLREAFEDPEMPEEGPAEDRALTPSSRNRLPSSHPTLAERLKSAGYATAHLGKWHLGWEPYDPRHKGYDFDAPGGSDPGPPGGYFAPFEASAFPDSPPGQHVDDRLAQEAESWLSAHKSGPFFLDLWLYSVHPPYQADPRLVAKYRRKADPKNPQHNPVTAAMVEALDAAVGRVLDALDRLGLADDTLVVFTSDNGGNDWEVVDGAPVTSNAPLRGGKGSVYEGGTRVPLIVAWPGHVPPGTVSETVASSLDLFPTVLEAAGRPPAAGSCDGVSLLPDLTGSSGGTDRDALFCHVPHYAPQAHTVPATWVRKGDWKLLRFHADSYIQTDRHELYQLRDDPGEQRDLSEEHPDLVRSLGRRIESYLADTGALVPRPNPAYRPEIAGWRSGRDSTIVPGGPVLAVQSRGDEPSITATDLPAARGPFTVELRMISDIRGAGRVLWRLNDASGFEPESAAPFTPVPDSQWHDYRITLPTREPIRAIRIDPGTAPGDARFALIRLADAEGRTVREWRFGPRGPGFSIRQPLGRGR